MIKNPISPHEEVGPHLFGVWRPSENGLLGVNTLRQTSQPGPGAGIPAKAPLWAQTHGRAPRYTPQVTVTLYVLLKILLCNT